MKKLIVLLALITTPAFAADFSGILENHPGEKMHECVHAGFQSTNMTEEQHTVVHKAMMDAMAVMDQHKDGIHAGMRAVMGAFSKHPIDRNEVVSAEVNLKVDMEPVREAMRDSLITGINVLSSEQRSLFDHAFMQCMHESNGVH